MAIVIATERTSIMPRTLISVPGRPTVREFRPAVQDDFRATLHGDGAAFISGTLAGDDGRRGRTLDVRITSDDPLPVHGGDDWVAGVWSEVAKVAATILGIVVDDASGSDKGGGSGSGIQVLINVTQLKPAFAGEEP